MLNGAFTWGARGIVDDSEDRPAGSATPLPQQQQHDESPSSSASASNAAPVTQRDIAGHRAEAKRLEDRVGVVAAKRCSVEEVQALLKEIEEWLRADVQMSAKTGGTVCLGGELMVRFTIVFPQNETKSCLTQSLIHPPHSSHSPRIHKPNTQHSTHTQTQFTSLELSAGLLHAILSNHRVHSEATKFARTVEASLRERCEKSEKEVGMMETEMKK
jgi:hypothetical protein